ncbi:MAG: hypothetical protein JNL81_14105 [Hyphomonadaceae bacterium]|nr:hypothetical protein [Hyphomonadaceae bacterium]
MLVGIFVPRATIMGQGTIGTGAALLAILIVVGMIHAFLVAVFSAIAAAIVTIGLLVASTALRWDANFKPRPLFNVLVNAFMAMTIVTWLLDLLLHSYFSVPTMIVALDQQRCDPYCAGYSGNTSNALIQSVSDYYRYAVATAPGGGWLRYLIQHIPGLIAFAWVLGSGEPDAFQDRIAANIALPGPGGRFADSATAHLARNKLKRLAVVSVISVGAALALAFPIFVQLMLGLRGLAH